MAVHKLGGTSYYINNQLKAKWDEIKDGKLKKMDSDRVYVVDGRERTGKSTFAMQQACYIDPTLIYDIKRICFTADEFLEAIRKTDSDEENTKCIIFDEAFRGLASRGAMSKTNKKIVQALMEVGQKNLVLWIVLPSFFMLDLYAAMLRSNTLFHLAQEKKSKRRTFYVYPHQKKGYLYQSGVRKGWSYETKTKSRGYFFDNFPKGITENDFYNQYLKKKRSSLVNSENALEEEAPLTKHQVQRDLMIYNLVKTQGMSEVKTSKYLGTLGIELGKSAVHEIIAKIDRARGLKKEITYESFVDRITASEKTINYPSPKTQVQ